MSAICLMDTSILLEFLNLPFCNENHAEIISVFKQKIEHGEKIFLPMATILETGNKIAQIDDGNLRRERAITFVEQVKMAIDGDSPFHPVGFLEIESFKAWLSEFPESASRGVGLCDFTIIQDYERLCNMNTGRRVYVWSLDEHLQGYSREATI